MNYVDYKFWFIKRDDDGFILESGIRFYEGKYKDVSYYDLSENKDKIILNQYVRIRKLQGKELRFGKGSKLIKDARGKDAVLYTQEDFGNIKTDDELRLFLNIGG